MPDPRWGKEALKKKKKQNQSNSPNIYIKYVSKTNNLIEKRASIAN